MWIEVDACLRDVVIIDPVAYFVKPATQIIRRHLSSFKDPTVHYYTFRCEDHEKLYKDKFKEFRIMMEDGIVTDPLLQRLLLLGQDGDHEDRDKVEKIIRLMVHFGLLVPRVNSGRSAAEG